MSANVCNLLRLRLVTSLRLRSRLWLLLGIGLAGIYLFGSSSYMTSDRSRSTLGLVHKSDKYIHRTFRNKALFTGVRNSRSFCNADVQIVVDPSLGDGCYFRNRLECDGMPTINSAFVDLVDNRIVFVGTRFRDDDWSNETFICEFPDGNISVADPILVDDRSMGSQAQYIAIITCPISEEFYYSFRPDAILRGGFSVNLMKNRPPFQTYRSIPLCKVGLSRMHYLSICTMVKDVDEYFEDWLLYYRYMGVDHVYVYDNSPRGTLLGSLDRFIKLGYVSVIPWAHTHSKTKTYLEVQIAHENDCLWRHRHDTDWMLKIDVDEYVQPMFKPESKLTDFLRNFEKTLPHSVAVIRVRNWFFSRPPSNVGQEIMTAKSVIERNPWRSPEPTGEGRGREKCFIRPRYVHYFKIHAVKLGAESVTLDPYNEMRLVHYRSENPRHRNFRIHKFIPDTSMVLLWRAINRWLLYTKDRVIMYGYRKHRYKAP